MTLGRRVGVTLAVVALVLLGSVAALLVVLRDAQRAELDTQATAAVRELVDRTPAAGGDRLPDRSVADRPGDPPRFPVGLVDAHATAVGAACAPFRATGADGRPYRVAAVRLPAGRVVVAAVSTEPADATFRRVAAGAAGAAGGLLAVLALLAWWVRRLGLRPIRTVAATAAAVAAGEVGRRVGPQPAGTEAAGLAAAVNRMADERVAAEGRLRRFVADASHELRTPLTTVAGVLELLAADRLDAADRAEAVRRARAEAGRMTDLIDDLLLLTELDRGRSPDRAAVDLAVLVRDAAVDARLVQPDRVVTVSAAAAAVRGDEARLRQVVANLVGNALRHTPRSAAVALSVRTVGGRCVLEVADDGPGLTAEQAGLVFDRFYRADPGRSRAAGGTGLGLSIVRSIVAAHGGEVSVTAAPGQGCRFRVDLRETSSSRGAALQDAPAGSTHDLDPI
jgi:two-component system OmpR family sensor kinase